MQCNTQVMELGEDLNSSDVAGDDTRMSVSIQVTHSVAQSGKTSTRRQIRISKQDLKNANKASPTSPDMERGIDSNDQLVGSFANYNDSGLKEDVESEEGSSAQPMSPRSQEGEEEGHTRWHRGGRDKQARSGTMMLEDIIKASQSSGLHALGGSYDQTHKLLSHEFDQKIQPPVRPLMRSGEYPFPQAPPAVSAIMPAGIKAASPVETEKLAPSSLAIDHPSRL